MLGRFLRRGGTSWPQWPPFPVRHHRSSGQQSTDERTHFGFQSVTESEKEQRVKEVFSNVAEKYDLMNDVMSCGIHRCWKDTFVGRLRPGRRTRLLDMAGGTGDVAFRAVRYIQHDGYAVDPLTVLRLKDAAACASRLVRAASQLSSSAFRSKTVGSSVSPQHKETVVSEEKPKQEPVADPDVDWHVTVGDINPDMLNVGRRRAAQELRLTDDEQCRLSFVQADAEQLPFADDSFDAYTIAFGIRNCTHLDKVLAEAFRVLRPGGLFMCLEFAAVEIYGLKQLYDAYSFEVIPALGQVVAGDWDSYAYLVESIRQFPDRDLFASMIEEAGFSAVDYEDLSAGIACIHRGFKL